MKTARKSVALLLCLVMTLSLFAGTSVSADDAVRWDAYVSEAVPGTDYEAVDGSVTEVKTALGLAYFAYDVNSGNDYYGKTVVLSGDIDIGAYYWVPIGQYDASNSDDLPVQATFRGTFDGGGHYIKNLTIFGSDYSGGSGVYNEANALFGVNYGSIKNVGVLDVDVDGYRCSAAIAGINYGSIEGCVSTGTIKANGGGGLRGSGGIVGSNRGTILYSYSSATVHNKYRRAGGIAGYNVNDGTNAGVIKNCYYTGWAESDSSGYSGSIAAQNGETSNGADRGGVIDNCYYLSGSAKDEQDNGCPAAYNNRGAKAFEFTAQGKLVDDGTALLAAIDAEGEYFKDGTDAFPILKWETASHGTPGGGDEEDETPVLTIKSAVGSYYFDDIPLTMEQLMAHTTTKTNYTRVSGGGTTEYSHVTGITLTDLLANFVPYGTLAESVAFATSDDFASTFKPANPEHESAMLLWSAIDATSGKETLTSFRAALNGGGGNMWTNNVVTVEVVLPIAVVVESSDNLFDAVPLTIEQLKEHTTTKTGYTRPSGSGTVTYSSVEGITLTDLLASFVPYGAYIDEVRFSDNSGYTSATFQPNNSEHESAMLLWSAIDSASGNETLTSLRSALDGSGGSYWASNVTKVSVKIASALTVRSADGIFDDIPLTMEQLMAHTTTKTGYTRVSGGGTTEYSHVTGITLTDLLANFVPYGTLAESVAFATSGDFASTFKPANPEHESAMLLWSAIDATSGNEALTSFRAALNGGGGSMWASDVTTVNVVLPLSRVTFSITPADAAIVVKDSKNNIVASDSNVYTFVMGETYSYELTRQGYIGASGTLTPARTEENVSKTLTQSGGGSIGGTSYSITINTTPNGSVRANRSSAQAGEVVSLTVSPDSGYGLTALSVSASSLNVSVSCNTFTYTFVMPSGDVTINPEFQPLILSLYTKRGHSGDRAIAAVFTEIELDTIATINTSGYAYLYRSNDEWRAIVATKLAALDSILNAAGVGSNWKSGSYLEFLCSDGEYTKSYPSYDDISSSQYFVSGDGSFSAVPAGIAIEWDSGSVGDASDRDALVSQLAASAYYGSLRFVYGVSQESYNGPNYAAGARSPSQVLEMTLVYEAVSIPDGSVGTTNTPSGDTTAVTTSESTDLAGNLTVNASVNAEDLAQILKSLNAGESLELDATSPGAKSVGTDLLIPSSALNALVEKDVSLILSTDSGTIAFDAEALHAMSSAAELGAVTVSIANVKDGASMNQYQKYAAGDNLVYRLEARGESGENLADFGPGLVTVSINCSSEYKDLEVYRIEENGETTIMNAVYKDGKVTWYTNSFSFYMLSERITGDSLPFTDISINDWFYDAVSFAYNHGLFTGMTPTAFEPNTLMTRAMLVTVLYRAEGKPSGGTSVFEDLDASAYYYNAISWAAGNGIVNGYSNSAFGANDRVTREQISVILFRYAQYKGYAVNTDFDLTAFIDADSVSPWAIEAMCWAVGSELIWGVGDGVLNPSDFATRAQVATILQRFVESVAE